MLIRVALAHDAKAISDLLQRVFTQTYAVAIPSDSLDRYLDQEFSPARLTLKLADPDTISIVAEANGDIIAFGRVEPRPLPKQPRQPDTAELTKLYVDAGFHGRGIAAQVLARTVAAAQDRGWHTLWLCVWEHNTRAITFYRKHGFAQVGALDIVVDDVVFHDWVMRKELKRLAINDER